MNADRVELLALLIRCSTRAHFALADRDYADAEAWIDAAKALQSQYDAA